MSNLVEVAKKEQFKEGTMISAVVDDKQIIIACVGGKYYAADRACTHAEGRLDWGTLEGTFLQCPKHRLVYDITNGKILKNPGGCGGGVIVENTLKTYPVKVDGESIKIDI